MDPAELCPNCLEKWTASPMVELPRIHGDGVTDDTAAVQAAIDAGVPVIGRNVRNSVCKGCGYLVQKVR